MTAKLNNIKLMTAKLNDISCMKSYSCTICEYIYNPEIGNEENKIPAGTDFDDLPDNWYCPVCGACKDDFDPQNH